MQQQTSIQWQQTDDGGWQSSETWGEWALASIIMQREMDWFGARDVRIVELPTERYALVRQAQHDPPDAE